jgi:hypothetical protein
MWCPIEPLPFYVKYFFPIFACLWHYLLFIFRLSLQCNCCMLFISTVAWVFGMAPLDEGLFRRSHNLWLLQNGSGSSAFYWKMAHSGKRLAAEPEPKRSPAKRALNSMARLLSCGLLSPIIIFRKKKSHRWGPCAVHNSSIWILNPAYFYAELDLAMDQAWIINCTCICVTRLFLFSQVELL